MTEKARILSFAEIKRNYNRSKAERGFARFYGEDASSEKSASQAPRAAVYRAEMGHVHKKSARMQNNGNATGGWKSGKSKWSARGLAEGVSAYAKKHLRAVVPVCVALAVVAFAVSVYPSARLCYTSLREYDRLQAEEQVVAARKAALEEENAYLESDSGVEEKARTDYGWVKEGENAVKVYIAGTTDKASQETSADTVVASGSVPAPETWYSPFLDVLFGYDAIT